MKRFLFAILFVCSCSKQGEENSFSTPIYFASFSQSPLMRVSIDGIDFVLKLDLGAACQLMLKQKALNRISEKEFRGKSIGVDIQGNRYEQPQFKVSNIKVGNLCFQEGEAEEENELFITKGSKPFGVDKTLREELQQVDGRIGSLFFHSSVCFLDLSQSLFWVGADLEDFKEHLNGMIQASFDFEKELVCVEFQTEQGPRKFVLDTGTSQTVFRRLSFEGSSKKIKIKNLQLGSLQIGQWSGCPLDFPEKLQDIDGILGIDFFKKFVVCIDFPNRKVYLKRS